MKKVSDLLKDARVEKKLTLDEVERETKIKKEFIESIEKGYLSSEDNMPQSIPLS